MEWWLLKNKIKAMIGIKDRLYRCSYCGVYSEERVSIKALAPFEDRKQYFCCEDCKERYIDTLLPPMARRYKD